MKNGLYVMRTSQNITFLGKQQNENIHESTIFFSACWMLFMNLTKLAHCGQQLY